MLRPNAHNQSSPSMGEVSACASTRTEGVRALASPMMPQEAILQAQRASPPQSALRADSSPIEGEQTRMLKVNA